MPRKSAPAHRCPTAVAVLTSLGLFLAAPPVALDAQEADAADVESIDAIMTAVYDVISGDAGVARDWDRFRSLFAEGATLSAVGRRQDGTVVRNVMTPDSYIERNGTFLETNGFHEVEIHRVAEQYGLIAHAFSTYESRRLATDPEPFTRGINSFQLMNDGARWYVVSIYWQGESPQFPIPAKYVGNK